MENRKPRYCMRCGTELREGVPFCHECGAPIPQVPTEQETSQRGKPRILILLGLVLMAFVIAAATGLIPMFRSQKSSPTTSSNEISSPSEEAEAQADAQPARTPREAYNEYLNNLIDQFDMPDGSPAIQGTRSGDYVLYRTYAVADFDSDGVEELYIHTENHVEQAQIADYDEYSFYEIDSAGNVVAESVVASTIPGSETGDGVMEPVLTFYDTGTVSIIQGDGMWVFGTNEETRNKLGLDEDFTCPRAFMTDGTGGYFSWLDYYDHISSSDDQISSAEYESKYAWATDPANALNVEYHDFKTAYTSKDVGLDGAASHSSTSTSTTDSTSTNVFESSGSETISRLAGTTWVANPTNEENVYRYAINFYDDIQLDSDGFPVQEESDYATAARKADITISYEFTDEREEWENYLNNPDEYSTNPFNPNIPYEPPADGDDTRPYYWYVSKSDNVNHLKYAKGSRQRTPVPYGDSLRFDGDRLVVNGCSDELIEKYSLWFERQ